MSRSFCACGRRSVGASLEPRHDQRQDDHRQRLDHELGEGQVWRAEQHVEQGDGKALDAERNDDRVEPAARP
jgi:hypothetical protein